MFCYFGIMEMTGNIRKMEASCPGSVRYHLPLGDTKVDMNLLLGKEIVLEYLGKINCIRCEKETKKSFGQGYCYPCFISAPETEECVLRPELCRAHEGVARDMDFAADHCLIEQVVYLSITSGLKVGVTRHTQVPTRWIDQGAVAAIELARTPNRYTAGLMEVAMKVHIADKTNWRAMLAGPDRGGMDLVLEKRKLTGFVPASLIRYLTTSEEVFRINYPVLEYPVKMKSLDLDKMPLVEGTLKGIKGQYLLISGNRVINIRKYGGYLIRLKSSG